MRGRLLTCLTQLTAFLANRRHFCLFLLELQETSKQTFAIEKRKAVLLIQCEKALCSVSERKNKWAKNVTTAYIIRAETDHKECSATYRCKHLINVEKKITAMNLPITKQVSLGKHSFLKYHVQQATNCVEYIYIHGGGRSIYPKGHFERESSTSCRMRQYFVVSFFCREI